MKHLNKKSVAIFHKIYSKLNEDGYLKLDKDGERAAQEAAKNNDTDIDKYRSGIMPLSVQKVGSITINNLKFEKISFAHYYEQEGDLMADPEMIFLCSSELPDMIIPCYFLQHNLGIEQNSIVFDDSGNFKGYYSKMQANQTYFVNSLWFKNIKWQQEL